ncbi:hypothetical protein NIES4071_36600 [Calothrix sp. NIES-4071]|nr:hypothetical protein NIES4071_36600 [Calothrix sp. NIES-4071]BAZ57979.1 hypothetical protein NIES4105_36530 [Calothrix sp. NIES-4105]
MSLSIQLLDEANARACAVWHYKAPLDFYNLNLNEIEQNVQYFLDPKNNFYGIFEEKEVIGFCSFGEDGQVNGGDYSVQGLDIGMGIRPDLIEQGRGTYYVEAVLNFASREFNPPMYRVTIAAFNQRALRVWSKIGFHPVSTFEDKSQGLKFIILVQEV